VRREQQRSVVLLHGGRTLQKLSALFEELNDRKWAGGDLVMPVASSSSGRSSGGSQFHYFSASRAITSWPVTSSSDEITVQHELNGVKMPCDARHPAEMLDIAIPRQLIFLRWTAIMILALRDLQIPQDSQGTRALCGQ
jgi:hypothetical protein